MDKTQRALRQALDALLDFDYDKRLAAISVASEVLAEPLAMQVRPSEFAQIIKGKETITGIPAYWAEWPNKE